MDEEEKLEGQSLYYSHRHFELIGSSAVSVISLGVMLRCEALTLRFDPLYLSDTISGSMPIDAVIERLVSHGCPNISSRLDAAQCNEFPISRGGFGDVYQGALLGGTKVALKCFRFYVNEREAKELTLKHAARELYTWSKCRHPNVVELLGLAEFRGQIAMVSPWMASGGIDQLNRSNRTIDRCRLCFQIAQGLAYLHETGVVHGDLKGANVLLSDNEDAQIADFGNAVLASNTLAFTESATRFGLSLRWAAPELLEGKASYNRQADIYSLGMEVISRQMPYADLRSEAGVMRAILQQQYPKRPEDRIPMFSKQGDNLWSLLEACWSWDPNGRPEAPSIVKVVGTFQSPDLIPDPISSSA
ncbi:hypothetical protein FRC12_011929 [Ceratobasidium sp. 428]|nr:hypothetical protein FRC12_011929 [Ceratobasidium sp. 428]